MNVKAAVNVAKNYVKDLFADEEVVDLGLEEVEFNNEDDIWNITVGFSRPQKLRLGALSALNAVGIDPPSGLRIYKVVRINDKSGAVLSVKNREPVLL